MTQESPQRPEDWTDEEIYREIGLIVSQFPLLKCDEAVRAVVEWLEAKNMRGTVLKIKTKYEGENYILSTRLERRGITESMTLNGQHYGIEIRGLVFDNLSAAGMTREDWLDDFQTISGEFTVTEIDSLLFNRAEGAIG